MADYKLDIFKVLSDLSSGNPLVYRALKDEEKKGFAPLVVMRWMTGTSDEAQILAMNAYANRFIFPLGKHPELLAQVLSACATGSTKRYQWLGVKSGKKGTLARQAVAEYLDYSPLEMKKITVMPPPEEIIEMAEACGWQKEELTKLKKELKDG